MSATHSPTPWHLHGKSRIRAGGTPDNDLVADVSWRNRDANAAFIVRAVNAHDLLVSALRAADAEFESLLEGWAVREVIAAALEKAEAQS